MIVNPSRVIAGFDTEEHEMMSMDGFDDCVVGVVERFGQLPILCYDREKVIESVMEQSGMERDVAEEYFEVNQFGAWVGETTPCFLSYCEEGDIVRE